MLVIMYGMKQVVVHSMRHNTRMNKKTAPGPLADVLLIMYNPVIKYCVIGFVSN